MPLWTLYKKQIKEHFYWKGDVMNQLKVNIKTYKISPKEFRINRSSESVIYTHRFPVYKHHGITTLDGEITIIGDTGDVIIDVYNMNRNIYPPFYHVEYGDFSPMLDKINNRINQELKKLGIKKNDTRAIRKTKKR